MTRHIHVVPSYDELSDQARDFLAAAGFYTIDHRLRHEQPEEASSKEILGVAVAVLAEQSEAMAQFARDHPELH